jgi:hypothetical protein
MGSCEWPGCERRSGFTFTLGSEAVQLCTTHADAAYSDRQALVDALSVWAFECDACGQVDASQTFATKPRPLAEDATIVMEAADAAPETEWKRPCPICGARDWTPVQIPRTG